jgi:hypothetical protein
VRDSVCQGAWFYIVYVSGFRVKFRSGVIRVDDLLGPNFTRNDRDLDDCCDIGIFEAYSSPPVSEYAVDLV